MTIEKYKHPVVFYGLSIAVPWMFWFITAWLSHMDNISRTNLLMQSIFGMIGLSAPMLIALAIFLKDKELWNDLKSRFFSFKGVKPVYIILVFTLTFSVILFAQAVSLLFGYEISQFKIVADMSFSAGLYPVWFILLIAPVLEELAWHSYGTDCLRRKFNLFTVSMIFGVFWVFWHLPLSFIKNYYQSNLVNDTGVLYSINYAVSLFPYLLFANWLYMRTNRNILLAVVFHITANFSHELFMTHPDTKVMETGIYLILTVILLIKEKSLFFSKELNQL